MSHTPGPWHVSDSNEVLDDKSMLVCAEIMGDNAEIYKANARLIAAAPEMLETLKTLDRLGGLGLDKHAWIREVIDKAEGK
jgi:hypothetical protein